MIYTPTLQQAKALKSQDGNLLPIYAEINADLETPVSAYLKIAREPYSFLLESAEGGERMARYSFIGTEPSLVLTSGMDQAQGAIDPLENIQKTMAEFNPIQVTGLPRFHGGMVGYLSYESTHYFEPRIHPAKNNLLKVPESIFMLANTLLIFDHLQHKIKVVSHANLSLGIDQAYGEAVSRIDELVKRLAEPMKAVSTPTDGEYTAHSPRSNLTKDQYTSIVNYVKKFIENGDCIQTVISQRFSKPTTAKPFDIYRSLRIVNPSSYMYYLNLNGFQIIGASPEMLVRVEGDRIDYHPIAGTRPRGANDIMDQDLENQLRSDEKEKAEHIMLVDLGRNDVGRVSQPGSVKVTQLMDVERYSHVMHLVSHVQGTLIPGITAYDSLRSCFPAGTVSGAPKIRAMEIIADLEPDQRGPYAGAVGYFSFSGNMDTAIAIRTIVFKDGIAHVQAGGGIVYDSIPENEYQECIHKASALIEAINAAENGLR